MEMFLMVATVSLLGMVVSVGLFAAATRDGASASELSVEQPLPAAPPRFFLADRDAAVRPRVPIEVLLLQIERHVRLEQAAAESFLDSPTIKSLHSRTTSPLVH